MPLYNNILLSRRGDDKSGSPNSGNAKSVTSASMKLLQDHLLSKRKAQQQNAPTKNQKQTNRSQDPKSSQIISESTLHKPLENDWDPEEEYDPMIPNSYELLLAEYLKSEEQRSISQKSTSTKTIPNLLEVLDKLDEGDDSYDVGSKKGKGTAIAPPPSLQKSIASEESDIGDEFQLSKAPNPQPNQEKLVGNSVAAKIMSKMGYKAGQGLGKDEQGMSKPLEVEKSGLNSGRILPAQVAEPKSAQVEFPQSEDKHTDKMAELLRDSTRILLLQNMVGPGEVDDELEAETKEECKKYGEVVKCLIYEIPNKRVPDEEAVRIFVEFRRVESAIKAASDLNGRYFGGRIVRASFYSVEKFNKYELNP